MNARGPPPSYHAIENDSSLAEEGANNNPSRTGSGAGTRILRSIPIIVSIHKWTPDQVSPDGDIEDGENIDTEDDAIIPANMIDFDFIKRLLATRASRKFAFPYPDSEGMRRWWFMRFRLGDRCINVDHQETWEPCRELLFTEEEAELEYHFIMPQSTAAGPCEG